MTLSLSSRSLELENAKKTILQIQSERSEREQSLSSRITDMRAEIGALKKVESEKNAATADADAQIDQIRAAKLILEKEIRSRDARLVELEGVVQKYLSDVEALRAEKDSYLAQESSIRDSLHNLDVAIMEHLAFFSNDLPMLSEGDSSTRHSDIASHVTIVISHFEKTSETVATYKRITNEATDRAASILQGLRAAQDQAQGSSAISEASWQGLTSQLQEIDELLQHTREENAVLRQHSHELQGQLTALEQSRAVSTSLLDDAHSTIEKLVEDLKKATDRNNLLASELQAKSNLQEALESSKMKASDLERSLEAATAEWKTVTEDRESRIAVLEKRVTFARNEADRLKSELQSASAEVEKMTLRLEESRAERTRIQVLLASTKLQVTALEKERDDALERIKELDEDIAGLRKSKEDDETTIQGLKDGLIKLRDIQMQSLAELENRV